MAINIAKFRERTLDWWYQLKGEERKNLVKMTSAIGLVSLLFGAYYLQQGGDDDDVQKTEAEPVVITDEYLDRDMDARINQAVGEQLEGFKRDLLLQFSELQKKTQQEQKNAWQDTNDHHTTSPIELPVEQRKSTLEQFDDMGIGFPIPPVRTSTNTSPENEMPADTITFIGGIDSQTVYTHPVNSEEAGDELEIKLPPGFMPAKLLIGIRAKTSQGASSSPKPVHLRVQAPAQLPNHIKMNLAGCFVIANTWGDLQTERIESELVSMHCITRDRRTLIEGDLMGYVADSDGVRDMGGRVVTKAGALIARKAAMDTLSGIGKVYESSAGTIQTSPLGTVRTLDPTEALQAGLAGGLSGGLQGAADYIGELLVQSSPVIESGAAKDVMLMIQKTTTLKIYQLKGA